MDLQRIQREFRQAQEHFPLLEAVPNGTGGLYVKAALQTSVGRIHIITVSFQGYPAEMPKIVVTKPEITHWKHRYQAGNICYMHPSMWNPGRHDLKFVLAQGAVWLNKHEVYMQKGTWPGPGLDH
jgi:ubiquitin-protein ligase